MVRSDVHRELAQMAEEDYSPQAAIATGRPTPSHAVMLYKLNRNSPANHGRSPLEARQRYVVLCI
jgi:hypothetical protein